MDLPESVRPIPNPTNAMQALPTLAAITVLAIAGAACHGEEPAAAAPAEAPAPAPATAYWARIVTLEEVADNRFTGSWTELGWTDGVAWDRDQPGQPVAAPDAPGTPLFISPYYPPHSTPEYHITLDREVTVGDIDYSLRKNANFVLLPSHPLRVDAGGREARWSIGETGRALRFMIQCGLVLDSDLLIKFNAQRDGELAGGTSGPGRLSLDLANSGHSGAAAFHQYTLGRSGDSLAHTGGTTLIGSGTDPDRSPRVLAGVPNPFGGGGLVLRQVLLDLGGHDHRVSSLEIDGTRIDPGTTLDSSHPALLGQGSLTVAAD
jgi:hypothetical protein